MNKQSKKTPRSDAVLGLIKTRSSEGRINEQPMEKPAELLPPLSETAKAAIESSNRRAKAALRPPDTDKQKRQKVLAMSLRHVGGAVGMLSSTRHAVLHYLQRSKIRYDDPAEKEIREVGATLDAAVRELQAMETAIRASNTVVKLLNDQEAAEKKEAKKAEKASSAPQFTVKSPLR